MKILIIRFSSLGDCILLCPLAAYLKTQGVEQITVVTKSAYADLFAAATGVDRVVAFNPSGSLGALLQIASEHRDGGWVVLDAHNNWRSRVLSWRLGGARGRFAKHYGERLGLIVFKRQTRLPSILDQYGLLAAAVGLPAPKLSPGGIVVPERFVTKAAQRLCRNDHKYIAMAPGARWPMKRWPVDSFVKLAERLTHDNGYRLLLMGDEHDRAVAAPIVDRVGERCVDITGQTGIIEGAGYLTHCSGFVGNDSGLTHLAEAVGVPAVALFGPTVDTFGYYPSLPASKAVERKLSCRPCSRNGSRPCPKRNQECMTEIGVDAVESAVIDMLSGAGPARYALKP